MKLISKKEYDSRYSNIIHGTNVVRGDPDEVTCPLCSFHGRTLSHHMRKEQGIKGAQFFKDRFPDYAQQTYDVWIKRRVNGETTIKKHGIAFLKPEAIQKRIRLNQENSAGLELMKDSSTGVYASETSVAKKPKKKKKAVAKQRFATFEDYKNFYDNVIDEFDVFCPFCEQGEERVSTSLSWHLRKVHNLTLKEARELHPKLAVVGFEDYEMHAAGAIALLNEHDGQAKATQGKMKSQLFHDTHAVHGGSLMKELHKDPAFRKKLRGPKKGNLCEFYSESQKKYYYLRSSFEFHVLEALESCNIKYVYEYGPIPYTMPDGSEHGYYPDFYLPDYNLIIEVKPSTYLKREDVKAKGEAVKKQGYKFVIIDETVEWSKDKVLQTIFSA